jgi:hypothetical protein
MNQITDKKVAGEVAIVFTAKSSERILREGGTSSWRLDRNHARQCVFAVCTRNAHAKDVEGREAHHSAFLVGKIKDVVPSRNPNSPERYLIEFSEFARVNIPDVWRGDRNPVKYAELKDLGIDPSKLKWERMPEPSEASSPTSEVKTLADAPLTMAQAKQGLAITFGVAPEAIEITIRG